MIALALPLIGIGLTLLRLLRRLAARVKGWVGAARPRQAAIAVAAALLVGLLVPSLWPDDDWRPYAPGERGTIGERLVSVAAVGRGSPGLEPVPRTVPAPLSGTGGGNTAGGSASDGGGVAGPAVELGRAVATGSAVAVARPNADTSVPTATGRASSTSDGAAGIASGFFRRLALTTSGAVGDLPSTPGVDLPDVQRAVPGLPSGSLPDGSLPGGSSSGGAVPSAVPSAGVPSSVPSSAPSASAAPSVRPSTGTSTSGGSGTSTGSTTSGGTP
jgi:hypothetical protein